MIWIVEESLLTQAHLKKLYMYVLDQYFLSVILKSEIGIVFCNITTKLKVFQPLFLDDCDLLLKEAPKISVWQN